MTILILHGHSGEPGIHWQQYLHDELIQNGHTVIMPDLIPHQNPKRQEWVSIVKNAISKINDELIIVGHSLGVPVGLYATQELGRTLSGFVSVAGYMSHIGFEPADNAVNKQFDIKTLNSLIKSMYVVYCPTDPYIPQRNSEELIESFNAIPVKISDGGHFESDSPYKKKFPKLLEIINLCSNG